MELRCLGRDSNRAPHEYGLETLVFDLGRCLRVLTARHSHTEAGQRGHTDTRTAYLVVAPHDLTRRRAAASLMDFQSVGVERPPTVLTGHQVRLQHTT
jgi:hypothetical protein